MSQSNAYVMHCARCAAIGVKPLTYHQFLVYSDKVQS